MIILVVTAGVVGVLGYLAASFSVANAGLPSFVSSIAGISCAGVVLAYLPVVGARKVADEVEKLLSSASLDDARLAEMRQKVSNAYPPDALSGVLQLVCGVLAAFFGIANVNGQSGFMGVLILAGAVVGFFASWLGVSFSVEDRTKTHRERAEAMLKAHFESLKSQRSPAENDAERVANRALERFGWAWRLHSRGYPGGTEAFLLEYLDQSVEDAARELNVSGAALIWAQDKFATKAKAFLDNPS
ncbi:MAG: hypothetical protein ABMA15_22370 [Vicinamibacterales bacterium]